MRNTTAKQLRKEITALDLALKMLRAETEGLRRSTVTMKKAMNAPLALWESHWFEALPEAEQMMIEKTARMISNALKPAPAINNTVTSTTPTKVTTKTIKTPAKKTRTKVQTEKRSKAWTKADDAKLMRMVKANEPNVHIADVLGRSVSACHQRVMIIKKRKK